MEKANKDIREAIEKAHLKHYEVANIFGISDGNFTRLLRLVLLSFNWYLTTSETRCYTIYVFRTKLHFVLHTRQ